MRGKLSFAVLIMATILLTFTFNLAAEEGVTDT